MSEKCAICGGDAGRLYLPGTLSHVCDRCWVRHRLDFETQGRLAKEYHDRHYDEKGNRKKPEDQPITTMRRK